MFGSDVLDVVVGMVFVFLLLSLICSGLNEFIETLVKNRARDLERGIRELVGDPTNATNFIEKFYNHPLVNSLFKGVYSADKKSNLPSYIPSANFAMAVMDLIKNPPETGIKLPPNVKAAYDIFAQQAAGDAVKLQASLEDWFNSGMDRVSGWYRRRAQWILVALGLGVAVAVNADSIAIARALSNDASLRKGLVALAQARANQQSPGGAQNSSPQQPMAGQPTALSPSTAAPASSSLQQLRQDVADFSQIGLPIGWPSMSGNLPAEGMVKHAVESAPSDLKRHGVGWLLTAIAVSMGAPFWFDLLGKIISVRTSLKPDTGTSSGD